MHTKEPISQAPHVALTRVIGAVTVIGHSRSLLQILLLLLLTTTTMVTTTTIITIINVIIVIIITTTTTTTITITTATTTAVVLLPRFLLNANRDLYLHVSYLLMD